MLSDEYRAATEGLAWLDRSDRGRLLVSGRAPVQMLNGILTAAIPSGPDERVPGVGVGRAAYSAVLTPKGRLITDLRVLRLDHGGGTEPGPSAGLGPTSGGAEKLLLEVPAEGLEGLVAHLGRFLPPRLARLEDVSDATGLLTLLGPSAAEWVSLEVLGLRVDAVDLEAMGPGEYRVVDTGAGQTVHAVRNDDLATIAFDVIADRATIGALVRRLVEQEVRRVAGATWTVLRVEAGRPAFGIDMNDETIPVEAGIHLRAIDYGKGCYTGQEVIVRLRDRGHVNRELRGLRLGSAEPPPAGTELFEPLSRGDRPVGAVTSAARSPRSGETLALGYVRREVQPGDTVRVGGTDGPEAIVTALDDGWASAGAVGN